MLDRVLEEHREDLLGPAAGPMGAEARSPRGLSFKVFESKNLAPKISKYDKKRTKLVESK